MKRLEFIFRAVNALASKRHEPITERFLAEAIRLEVEIARREIHVQSAPGVEGRRTLAPELHDLNAGHSQV
jgi:hypothetical protein